MIRYLTESDVHQLLTMKDAVRLVEDALKARAEGRARDVPRVRTHTPQGTLHILEAAALDLNRIGYKAYYSVPGGTGYHVQLYDRLSPWSKRATSAWCAPARQAAWQHATSHAKTRPSSQ